MKGRKSPLGAPFCLFIPPDSGSFAPKQTSGGAQPSSRCARVGGKKKKNKGGKKRKSNSTSSSCWALLPGIGLKIPKRPALCVKSQAGESKVKQRLRSVSRRETRIAGMAFFFFFSFFMAVIYTHGNFLVEQPCHVPKSSVAGIMAGPGLLCGARRAGGAAGARGGAAGARPGTPVGCFPLK